MQGFLAGPRWVCLRVGMLRVPAPAWGSRVHTDADPNPNPARKPCKKTLHKPCKKAIFSFHWKKKWAEKCDHYVVKYGNVVFLV